MSEEQVVRLVHRLSKIRVDAASKVPKYIKRSVVWEKIRNFFPDTVGREE